MGRTASHVKLGVSVSVALSLVCVLFGRVLLACSWPRIDIRSVQPAGCTWQRSRNAEPIQGGSSILWKSRFASRYEALGLRGGNPCTRYRILAQGDHSRTDHSGTGVQQGDTELIKKHELVGFELYHLKDDPSQSHDLANSESERLQSLAKKIIEKYSEIQQEARSWDVP